MYVCVCVDGFVPKHIGMIQNKVVIINYTHLFLYQV